MKIVVVASLAYSLINFRGALLGEMVAAGHDVIACAPDQDAEIIAALAERGISFRQIPMDRAGTNPIADLATLRALVGLFRAERPDIVLAYTQKPIVYAGLATRIVGKMRFFAMVSGLGHVFSEGEGSWLVRTILSRLYRVAIAHASAVFVFNGDDAGEMRALGILRPHHRVIQVPGSGVDLSRFPRRDVPLGAPVFLLVARLLRGKGLGEFVDAARQVRRQHPECRFLILGPRDANPDCVGEDELRRWAEEGVVDYLGETRNVAPHLAAASVFVLPTYYREGLPRTILEAMATGRAIITTDTPGCRETVIGGENGFLVPPRNSTALAEAMLRFAREPMLAATMGGRSHDFAVETFAVEKVNAILLGAMRLRPGDPPDPVQPRRAPIRRAVDIAVSFVAGILLLPFIALLALFVSLSMGRPVLFAQMRGGQGGRAFRLVKFRTMTDARDRTGQLLPDDARITGFGRFLRRSRLDELPELWNILKGDMSLIGPRPLLPGWAPGGTESIAQRAVMRPGLTGWAQVNGNTLLSDEDKLALDLWYVDHASLRTDISIIARTIGVVLHGERINQPEVRRAYAGHHRRGG